MGACITSTQNVVEPLRHSPRCCETSESSIRGVASELNRIIASYRARTRRYILKTVDVVIYRFLQGQNNGASLNKIEQLESKPADADAITNIKHPNDDNNDADAHATVTALKRKAAGYYILDHDMTHDLNADQILWTDVADEWKQMVHQKIQMMYEPSTGVSVLAKPLELFFTNTISIELSVTLPIPGCPNRIA